MTSMLLAALLAAASTAAPAAAAQPTLDMVPAFIGACMANGPDPDRIRATVLKAGGQAVQLPDSSAAGAAKSEVYSFPNQGAPYSVIFDQGGTCLVVTGRADVEVTKASLDRLVIGSSKVFDISQTEGKPRAPGEKVIVEYRLTSKNKKGGMLLTLSRVTETGKGSAVFLTRRIFNEQ